MPKKMKITATKIVPTDQPVTIGEAVDITTENDCTVVILGSGFSVKLKKNQTCALAVTSAGHHQFEAVMSGSTAGPIGDIHVP